MLEGGPPIASWPEIAGRLRQGSDNDVKLAKQLDKAIALAPDSAALDDYLLVFLNQKLEPRGSDKAKIITKGLREADPALLELMEAERDRLAALLEKRNAGRALERSLALTRLGREIVGAYEQLKTSRGLLDFDDLIAHARDLLRRSNPSWILYKLDHQIGHILLDEAQDTSGEQWEILASLAEEFAQEQQPSRRRTLFAVGDEKQSIYSFQGAAPEKFEQMRRVFENRFNAAGLRFESVRLALSFRSSPEILKAVDASLCERGKSARPLLRSRRTRARAYRLEERRARSRRNLGADRPRKEGGACRLASTARLCLPRRSRRDLRAHGGAESEKPAQRSGRRMGRR